MTFPPGARRVRLLTEALDPAGVAFGAEAEISLDAEAIRKQAEPIGRALDAVFGWRSHKTAERLWVELVNDGVIPVGGRDAELAARAKEVAAAREDTASALRRLKTASQQNIALKSEVDYWKAQAKRARQRVVEVQAKDLAGRSTTTIGSPEAAREVVGHLEAELRGATAMTDIDRMTAGELRPVVRTLEDLLRKATVKSMNLQAENERLREEERRKVPRVDRASHGRLLDELAARLNVSRLDEHGNVVTGWT